MHQWVHDPSLDEVPNLRHAVTTRVGGVSRAPYGTLNVGLGSEDLPEDVRENRRRVAAGLGFARLVTPYQVHGNATAVVRADETGRPRCDALVTNECGVLLGVLGADCPGVLLVDASRHALAVVHAGWRGVAGGAVGSAFGALASSFGCHADDVRAWIGPGIGVDRYEVSDAVVDAVRASLPAGVDLIEACVAVPTRAGHAQLALQAALRLQLAALGIPSERIAAVDACTYDESDRFYSYRRDGMHTGRHALVAGWIA